MLSYNYYFLTGWDVDTVYQTALEMVNNTWGISKKTSEYLRYFSICPNNIELLGIFVVCLKMNHYLGVLDTSNPYYFFHMKSIVKTISLSKKLHIYHELIIMFSCFIVYFSCNFRDTVILLRQYFFPKSPFYSPSKSSVSICCK